MPTDPAAARLEVRISADTRLLTAHVPSPLAVKIDEIAQRLERSRGWVIKQALADWVEREEKRYALTLEGLADVDAERLVDQASVEAWAERLSSDDSLPAPQPR